MLLTEGHRWSKSGYMYCSNRFYDAVLDAASEFGASTMLVPLSRVRSKENIV